MAPVKIKVSIILNIEKAYILFKIITSYRKSAILVSLVIICVDEPLGEISSVVIGLDQIDFA